MTLLKVLMIALTAAAAFGSAQAQNAPSKAKERPTGEQKERPHGPPPEALEACKALAAGAACNFTSPRGAVKGSCWAPEGRPLACRPNDRPQPPAGGASSGSAR